MADKLFKLSAFKQMLRRSTRKAMEPISAAAKVDVLKLKQPYIRRRGKIVRLRGVVHDAIMVRRSKNAERSGNVGAFVNVKPLPGNKWKPQGRKQITTKAGERKWVTDKWILVKKTLRTSKKDGWENPLDPWYWQFLEGVGKKRMKPFLSPQKRHMPQAVEKVKRDISVYLAKRGVA